jgi:hypothetical protein
VLNQAAQQAVARRIDDTTLAMAISQFFEAPNGAFERARYPYLHW